MSNGGIKNEKERFNQYGIGCSYFTIHDSWRLRFIGRHFIGSFDSGIDGGRHGDIDGSFDSGIDGSFDG